MSTAGPSCDQRLPLSLSEQFACILVMPAHLSVYVHALAVGSRDELAQSEMGEFDPLGAKQDIMRCQLHDIRVWFVFCLSS